jgi:hypothetical protein|tara:strand:+ start:60 stop:371 length:312 start_codon:yes stop_codon:yes gene_type:complete
MSDKIQIVGELSDEVKLPEVNLGRGPQALYKTKAKKFFETMKIGQSFSVKSRSVEAVKKWAKDWRRDLRATGEKKNETLANRGFITKYEIVGKTRGVRVWRYI